MSNAAAAAVHKPAIAEIDIASIDANPDNPRRVFKRIEELAQSVRERGILVPIRLRPVGARFQLVFGERRWRAAKLAGVKTIPSIVEQLTDKEVLELMLIELANDEDVSPLEQSETFQKLLKHGNTPDDIAAKTGLSKRVVYERLQLAKLGSEGKKALAEEKINASVALLIARIPAELQAQAVKDVADDQSALSYRAAAEHIHKNFMLQLKDAPFDVTDAKLVAKAGACSTCPKRTGNQRELFGDVKSPDVCTDPKCYQGKEDALWQIKVKEAEGKGQKVLSAHETKEVFPYEHTDTPRYGSPFRALDDEEWIGDKHRTVKSILGKDTPPTVLARTPQGKIVEMVSADVVQKKIRELQPERPRPSTSDAGDGARERALKVRQGAVPIAIALIVEKAEQQDSKFLRFMADAILHHSFSDGVRRAVARRGLKAKDSRPDDAFEKELRRGLTDEGLRGWITEIVAGDNAPGGLWGGGYAGRFTEACRIFGVDVKKIEAQEKSAKKAKAAAKVAATLCKVKRCGKPPLATGFFKGFCSEHAKTKGVEQYQHKPAPAKKKAAAKSGKSGKVAKKPAKKSGKKK